MQARLDRLERSNRALAVELEGMEAAAAYGMGGGIYSEPIPEWGRYLSSSEASYACTKLRAEAVSSVPIALYKKKIGKDSGKEELDRVTDHPVLSLLKHVNPHWTFSRLMAFHEHAMCSYGQSFWALEEPARGMPTEIWWLHPARLTPRLSAGKYIVGWDYQAGNTGRRVFYKPNEIVPFISPNIENEFQGLSPFEVLKGTMDGQAFMDRYNAAFFRNYGAPAVTLETEQPVDPSEAAGFLRGFEKSTRGVDKAYSTALLPKGLKANVISETPKDSQFNEGSLNNLYRICRVLGVPPTLVAVMGVATYNNVSTYEAAFWKHTNIPSLRFYEDILNEYVLPLFFPASQLDQYVLKYDTSGVEVLQEDQKAKNDSDLVKWQTYNLQTASGIVKKNEVREKEGMKPLPELDQEPDPQQLQPGQQSGQDQPDQSKDKSGKSRDKKPKVKEGFVLENRPTVKLSSNTVTAPKNNDLALAIYWTHFTRALEPCEADIERAFKSWLQTIETDVLRTIRESRPNGAETSLQRGLFDSLSKVMDITRLEENAHKAFGGAIKKAIRTGIDQATDVLSKAGVTIDAGKIAEMAKAQVTRLAGLITKTTRDDVLNKVKRLAEQGLTAVEIASAIKDTFTGYKEERAKTVAITETTLAANTGALSVFEAAGVERKQWVTQLDGRVRETHSKAHGQKRDMRDKFVVGGYEISYPGDPEAPGSETVNCRCRVAPAGSDDEEK